jgi:enterochelin esterase family protein
MKRYHLHFFLLCFVLLFTNLAAQRPPAISSPDVHSDGSVTFRYFSKTASKITLNGEFLTSSIDLVKDTSGIWSVTVPPVKPDIYPYSFTVENVQTSDPNNTYLFANERFKRSIVEIPGKEPLIHSLQNVPHGKLHYRYYNSKTLNIHRQVLVYTPPNMDLSDKTKYPVLYLIHGGSDTEETWTKVGKTNLIADNLIAQGKSKSMIIVMPYGNVRPAPLADFTKDVALDIIPFIDQNYPTINNAGGRAIAGFSFGGGQTLNIGFTNLDKFATICSYAPYTATEEFKTHFSNWSPDANQINSKLKLFTISVGTEDFLYESVKNNITMFKDKGINIKPFIVDGGHTWMNCKLFLSTTLQEIFKN